MKADLRKAAYRESAVASKVLVMINTVESTDRTKRPKFNGRSEDWMITTFSHSGLLLGMTAYNGHLIIAIEDKCAPNPALVSPTFKGDLHLTETQWMQLGMHDVDNPFEPFNRYELHTVNLEDESIDLYLMED